MMARSRTRAMERLEKALLPGEEIWWHGTPNEFRLFEPDAKMGILCKWCGSAVAVVIAVLFCVRTGKTLMEIWLLPAILAVLVLSPFWERRNLLRYQYWITNKRVLLMAQDGSISAMDQELVDDCKIIRGLSGGDCLILGSQIFEEAPKQLRWQACHPRTIDLDAGGRTPNLGMVFYALGNADEAAEQLLCRKLG